MNMAVNVVDETGAPVGGLKKDDFEILEDGKAQKIAVLREGVHDAAVDCAGDRCERERAAE